MDDLRRIQDLVRRGRVEYTPKAQLERRLDELEPWEVAESILDARRFRRKRSRSPWRRRKREWLCIIEGFSRSGILIYTKGTIRREEGPGTFFSLISAKRSTTI